MAACPALNPSTKRRRRPIIMSPRRLEANRRNAARSTGPRTAEGKARVARNAIKHGFFVTQEKWTPEQHRDFAETLAGLRDDFRPRGLGEESCVWIIAHSYVQMAAMLRYENLATLQHHQEEDRALEARIAAADEPEAARLRAYREELRRAGLWGPTIPGPREARAIIRYEGRLNRAIRDAASRLQSLRNFRIGAKFGLAKIQKQTHYSVSPNSDSEARRGTSIPAFATSKVQKQTHLEASPNSLLRLGEGPQTAIPFNGESAKTNPLSALFMGNRHERRRAKALARRHT